MRIPLFVPAALLTVAAGCVSHPGGRGDGSTDLVVAAVTDVHGRLRGWNYESNQPDAARGLSRAATVVDSLRRAAPGRVVLLDAGDLLQGNALTYVAARVTPGGSPHPVIAAMNAMAFDAAAIGNHEFNYGLPFLAEALKQSRFPFLAANAYRPDGTRAFLSWTLVERAGVRVGIIGATTPGAMVWDRENLSGRLLLRDIVPEVRAAVADVREVGAEVVLLTMHSGLDGAASYDTVATGLPSENVAARVAREVPGIDLIVYGHSHQEVADTTINGVLLMQPRNWATSVAIAHLAVERTDGAVRVTRKSASIVQSAGHAESPAVLAATDRAHRETVTWVTTPVGRTTVAWRADSARVVDTPLIDFVLEVQRRAAGSDLSSTSAFSLEAAIDAGPITAARLQALYPYDNTLRAIRLSGAQLRAYLEHSARYFRADATGAVGINPSIPGYNFDIVSGVDYSLDVSRPVGQRVVSLVFRGQPVQPTASFTMALNNYRQSGGGGYAMLRDAPVVYDRQQEIRQLLIDEVRRQGRIDPADYFVPNWTIVPSVAVPTLYAALWRSGAEGARPGRPAVTAPAAVQRPPMAGMLRPSTRLRIIGTNDFHGALEPRADANGTRRGGAAYLADAVRRAGDGCTPPACEIMLLDGGDAFQGTPASNLAYGRPVVEIFNAMGYAAAALGNHEFDWGQDTLRARMREARYAILAANVRDTMGRPVPWIRSDTLVTRGALRIGVVGVATVSTPTVTKASNVANLRFPDPVPIVDSIVRGLRARGAHYVVVVAHAGAFCERDGATRCGGEIVDLARRLAEPVDAIVSGHTHSLIDATINGIPIVQARSSGTAIGAIELSATGPTHRVADVLTDALTPDVAVAQLVRTAVARVAPVVDRPVATLASALTRTGGEYPLGNLIADAMRAEGRADFAVMNNGGIRANLSAGRATYGALFEVQPFANGLYRLTVTGAALRAYIASLVATRPAVHVSGATIAYDSTRTGAARLVAVRMAEGRPLRDSARYTLVISDYLATSGAGIALSGAATRRELLPAVDLDAFVHYLRVRPQPVQAPRDIRFVLTVGAR